MTKYTDFKIWPPDIDFQNAANLPDVSEQREEAHAWALANGCSLEYATGFYNAANRFIAFRFLTNAEAQELKDSPPRRKAQYAEEDAV